MARAYERFWTIEDGRLGTVYLTKQGIREGFTPAKIVPRSAEGYTVAMRSAGLQKCFDYEIDDSFVDFDNWFCQEHKCAIARTIIVKYAGLQTAPITLHESDPIPVEVDEEVRSQLTDIYIRRIFV